MAFVGYVKSFNGIRPTVVWLIVIWPVSMHDLEGERWRGVESLKASENIKRQRRSEHWLQEINITTSLVKGASSIIHPLAPGTIP